MEMLIRIASLRDLCKTSPEAWCFTIITYGNPLIMIRKGSNVKWQWGQGEGYGKVVETFDREVSRTIKGSSISRKGSAENKALLIRQDSGDEVLKLESEVDKA